MDYQTLAKEEEDNLNYYVNEYLKSLIVANFRLSLRAIRMVGRAKHIIRHRRITLKRVLQYVNNHFFVLE